MFVLKSNSSEQRWLGLFEQVLGHAGDEIEWIVNGRSAEDRRVLSALRRSSRALEEASDATLMEYLYLHEKLDLNLDASGAPNHNEAASGSNPTFDALA